MSTYIEYLYRFFLKYKVSKIKDQVTSLLHVQYGGLDRASPFFLLQKYVLVEYTEYKGTKATSILPSTFL